jgi:hypothetical protein
MLETTPTKRRRRQFNQHDQEKHMATVTVDIDVTINGQKSGHKFAAIQGKDARHLGNHLIVHALQKVNAMMPDDLAQLNGSNVVSFDYVVTRDDDGVSLGGQHNEWNTLNDTQVAGLQGAYDGAVAKLDKHIAAKGHKK